MGSISMEPDPEFSANYQKQYEAYVLALDNWRKRMLEMPELDFLGSLQRQMIRDGKIHEEMLAILDFRGRVKALNNSAVSPL